MNNRLSTDQNERRRCRQDKELPVIHSINDLFPESMDYWTYRLANRSSRYDSEVARIVLKCIKRLQVQMNSGLSSWPNRFRYLVFSRLQAGSWHEWSTPRCSIIVVTLIMKHSAAAAPNATLHYILSPISVKCKVGSLPTARLLINCPRRTPLIMLAEVRVSMMCFDPTVEWIAYGIQKSFM